MLTISGHPVGQIICMILAKVVQKRFELVPGPNFSSTLGLESKIVETVLSIKVHRYVEDQPGEC